MRLFIWLFLQQRLHRTVGRHLHSLHRRHIQNHNWYFGVHRLRGWHVLHEHRRDAGGDVSCVSEQHVFRGVGFFLYFMPGERAVGRRQRRPGVLLLQTGIRACGGLVHVPDLRAGDVEQPAGANGVLELLDGAVLFELWRNRERDVSLLCARSVVAGGQREL